MWNVYLSDAVNKQESEKGKNSKASLCYLKGAPWRIDTPQ